MLDPRQVISVLVENGFRFASGVPCSYLKPLINCACSSPGVTYIAAPNEGDALAVASGAVLAGGRAMVLLQNSGLGNLVNPLTSLNLVYRIPVLLFVTLRGEPGFPDEPQHEVMGPLTEPLLTTLGIPWAPLPMDLDEFSVSLARARDAMEKTGKPFAFVIRKDAFTPASCAQFLERPESSPPAFAAETPAGGCGRRDAISALVDATRPDKDLIVSTTGFISRQLYELADRPNHFYMAGSMGCASGIALGLALQCPTKRVIALDGDGAILMRMGSLAMNGYYAPSNFVHIVLDNGSYESTGGQHSLSKSVNLAAVAKACGYACVATIGSADRIPDHLTAKGPLFLRVLVANDPHAKLPRPKQHSVEIKERFMKSIQDHA